MKFTVAQIAQLLEGEIEGSGEEEVSILSKIEEANTGSISFLSNLKYEQHVYTTTASAVIVNKDFKPKKKVATTLIRVDDPYSSFTVLLEEYHKIITYQKEGVEEPSFLGQDVSTGENLYRGAFSYIGKGSTIGRNVKIYPQVYIGEGVKIGDNSVILAGAKIYSNSIIGSNCTIHAGAVIGSDGFGFAPQSDGSYKTIPQLGNVVLEDWVSIGANAAIDCATLGSTIIRQGVKIDNMVQIAHNVEIGKNTVVAAQTGIAGSTKIGECCILAGQVGIAGHLTIGNKTTITAQSGLGKNIMKEGTVLTGSPAFERTPYMKATALFRNLPELHNRIKELEEKILNLRPSDRN